MHYRAEYRDARSRFVAVLCFTADDDAQARRVQTRTTDLLSAQLWCGSRRVGRMDATGEDWVSATGQSFQPVSQEIPCRSSTGLAD